jgi:general secretion pathway protein B
VGVFLIMSVGVLAWLAWRGSPAAPTPAAAVAPPANPTATARAPAAGALVQAPPAAVTATAPALAPASPAAAPTFVPTPAQSVADGGDANPADSAPAVTPPAGSAREGGGSGNLHNYAELGGSLPELRLDLHVYSASPAERYAFINMHKVREGDTTAEGVQVKEITREGVVLDYRGTEFLLGRQ